MASMVAWSCADQVVTGSRLPPAEVAGTIAGMRNRVVMITGASSGIGAATAKRLAQTSRVALVARRQGQLDALQAAIAEQGGEALVIADDLSEAAAAARVVQRCVDHFGELDALVNNAGTMAIAPGAAVDAEHIDRQFALNVRAPMLLVQAALPHLAQEGGGWIVNVSSVAAEQTFARCSVYSATKSAVETWSRVLREELREQGVRVAVVAPGATDTAIFDGTDFDRSKMARSEDVAQAIDFILNTPASAAVDRLVITPPGGAL